MKLSSPSLLINSILSRDTSQIVRLQQWAEHLRPAWRIFFDCISPPKSPSSLSSCHDGQHSSVLLQHNTDTPLYYYNTIQTLLFVTTTPYRHSSVLLQHNTDTPLCYYYTTPIWDVLTLLGPFPWKVSQPYHWKKSDGNKLDLDGFSGRNKSGI